MVTLNDCTYQMIELIELESGPNRIYELKLNDFYDEECCADRFFSYMQYVT